MNTHMVLGFALAVAAVTFTVRDASAYCGGGNDGAACVTGCVGGGTVGGTCAGQYCDPGDATLADCKKRSIMAPEFVEWIHEIVGSDASIWFGRAGTLIAEIQVRAWLENMLGISDLLTRVFESNGVRRLNERLAINPRTAGLIQQLCIKAEIVQNFNERIEAISEYRQLHRLNLETKQTEELVEFVDGESAHGEEMIIWLDESNAHQWAIGCRFKIEAPTHGNRYEKYFHQVVFEKENLLTRKVSRSYVDLELGTALLTEFEKP